MQNIVVLLFVGWREDNMFISHKSNVLQQFHETEWQCRRMTKGLTKPEYWTWIDSVTDADGNVDYSGETGYTIVECTDEDVDVRLKHLADYINSYRAVGVALVYSIKYYASKRDAEEILDAHGTSYDPKQYVSSHFIGDDDAKDACLLAEEWTEIRNERTRLLADTDWMASSDVTLNAAWRTYRQELRDLPSAQGSVTSYDDINWPSKPS